MLEKLLELLLHAKSGAVAAVFVVGATGALVTATVQNGTTTITITQTTASPTGTATASPTATATATPTATATATPTASPEGTGKGCSDWAHERADAVQTVNNAYAKLHSELMKLRKDTDKEAREEIIEEADEDLKDLRQTGVKAIHELDKCKNDDDDEDDEDQDEQSSGLLGLLLRLFGNNATTTVVTTTATPTPTGSPAPTASPSNTLTAPLVTGSTPAEIAESTVAAMQAVFDAAKAELEELADDSTTQERANRGSEKSNKDKDGHGKGKQGQGNNSDRDDDDEDEDDD